MSFSLADISPTHRQAPPRILVHGVPGIGKSTFGASLPAPIFIQCEDGLDGVNAQAFPLATSFDDVLSQLRVVFEEGKGTYQTVVIDTIDALERLIWAKVAEDNKVDSIEGIPYGKGYIFAANYWEKVLGVFNFLRQNGFTICLLCHTNVKRFQSPTTDAYDRYELSLHKGANALLVEWCDVVGFANWQVMTKSEDAGFNKKISKGIGTGNRKLHLVERPAWIAKNRYSLPDEINFSWADLSAALNPQAQEA